MATRRARAKAAVGVGSLANEMAKKAMAAELARTGRRGLGAQMEAYKAASEAMDLVMDLVIAYSCGPRAGDWPTYEEAAEVEGLPSARTFYRRLKIYRRIFGDDADPYELARRIYAEFSGRLEAEGPAVGFDLPAEFVALA